ncbi:hypothetical protein Cgig2_001147 [Carnegiea gigantea]|uniref:Uncharacterized protein n=1 Tax=Carnegiea gigantea TaxID=171969 RepID=A0A9Q1K472_9CARY|nr:hypothetical protein Cgig2_001147 [Carnegiea gigantea]
MAFPRSLDTKAMNEFVIRRFLWDRRGRPSPRRPSQKTSGPDAQTSIWPQLNKRPPTMSFQNCRKRSSTRCFSMRLRSLVCCMGRGFGRWRWPLLSCVGEHLNRGSGCLATESTRLDSARKAVQTKAQGPVVKGRARVGERQPMMRLLKEKLSVTVCAISMAFPPTHSTREMANYVRETFTWCWRSASRPPRPLPADFNVLCPCFSLAEAEAAVAESELSEIIQVTFYAILLNKILELVVVHEYTAERMRSLLVGLRWSTFEVWMCIMDEVIRGAQLHCLSDEVEVKGARCSQGEASGSAAPSTPLSDEE